jgi:hypothetical protein
VIKQKQGLQAGRGSVIRKAVPWLGSVLLGVLIVAQWQDIIRYLKIRQMSLGQGRPQVVPAAGRTAYPQNPASSAPDGTGEFDSASRGGPAPS